MIAPIASTARLRPTLRQPERTRCLAARVLQVLVSVMKGATIRECAELIREGQS